MAAIAGVLLEKGAAFVGIADCEVGAGMGIGELVAACARGLGFLLAETDEEELIGAAFVGATGRQAVIGARLAAEVAGTC